MAKTFPDCKPDHTLFLNDDTALLPNQNNADQPCRRVSFMLPADCADMRYAFADQLCKMLQSEVVLAVHGQPLCGAVSVYLDLSNPEMPSVEKALNNFMPFVIEAYCANHRQYELPLQLEKAA